MKNCESGRKVRYKESAINHGSNKRPNNTTNTTQGRKTAQSQVHSASGKFPYASKSISWVGRKRMTPFPRGKTVACPKRVRIAPARHSGLSAFATVSQKALLLQCPIP